MIFLASASWEEPRMKKQSTIAAIATGAGGGIGIVRLSGVKAFEIAGEIFYPKRGNKLPMDMAGYTGALGKVVEHGQELDEAVMFVYRSPQSYTGEDVVEFCCHGGRFVLEQVLAATIAHGAVPAGPGEFTKRAFLNGKMSLTQAESVADIIASENSQAVRAALRARDGALYRAVMALANELTDSAAHISAWIDYPEEDVEEVLTCQLENTLTKTKNELKRLVSTYHAGRLMREGIPTAIVGSANVGKSTLMNLLAGCQKSIVTDIPGTTRDVIEDTVRIGDLMLNLSDTAGIRETADVVERIGVDRSLERMETAELILAVIDSSRPLEQGDKELLDKLKGRLCVVLLNKSDLKPCVVKKDILPYIPEVLEISAKNAKGVKELEKTITRLVGMADLNPNAGLIANQRQLSCVTSALTSIEEAMDSLGFGQTLDAVSVCIEEALDALLELTGERASVHVIDRVFENFCVGK